MPRALKRARNFKDMRAARKINTEDALYDIADTVLDFLDVEAEGEKDRAPPGSPWVSAIC